MEPSRVKEGQQFSVWVTEGFLEGVTSMIKPEEQADGGGRGQLRRPLHSIGMEYAEVQQQDPLGLAHPVYWEMGGGESSNGEH